MTMTTPLPPDRSHVTTEQRNPRSAQLHRQSTLECLSVMHSEDRQVHEAIGAALPALGAWVAAILPAFRAGGRLIYVGAGTSGRLGVLDASEMPPTFQLEPGRVIGVIAGGEGALRRSSESAEDELRGAEADLHALGLRHGDAVLGITAGGTTPYVVGALTIAKDVERRKGGATRIVTGLLTCALVERPADADHLVVLDTGPEILTGSTRLKAGTATKLALNMMSTTLMVQSGRVYGNLMVDVRATNAKLRDRAARIIGQLTSLDRRMCFALLESADGSVKTALAMHFLGISRAEAEKRLSDSSGRLDQVIGDSEG